MTNKVFASLSHLYQACIDLSYFYSSFLINLDLLVISCLNFFLTSEVNSLCPQCEIRNLRIMREIPYINECTHHRKCQQNWLQ